jgi:predicted Zn-dependent peptidase
MNKVLKEFIMNKKSITLFCLAALVVQICGAIVFAEKSIDKIKFPKLSDPKMPDIETIDLDNGIRLYLLEDHKLPLINAYVRIAVGSYLEPLDKIGLASITGSVMRTGGSERMPGDDIDETLESLGAMIESGIDMTSGMAVMNILSDYTDTGLEILADILRRPIFDPDKIDLAKTEHRTAISRRNDEPWDICKREYQKIIYGAESPYARHTEYETIDNISREDLIEFHKRYITPENIMIAVWGDFKKKEMIQKIKKSFGDWPTGTGQVSVIPSVEYKHASSISYVERTNINQSRIRIGHIGGFLTDEDYYAAIVMNNILGAPGGRLFNYVRSQQGLAYEAGANYRSHIDYQGYFFAYCFTKSETTIQAINSIIEQISKMQTDPPTEMEMQFGKDSYLNSFVFNFADKGDIIQNIMDYDYYGLPRDFLFKVKENVEKVTPDDVIAAVNKRLHPDNLHIVVVGNGNDFDGSLDIFGQVDTIDVSIPTGQKEEEIEVTTEALTKGKELIKKAAEACGGIEKIQNIKSIVTSKKVNVFTPQGEFSLTAESSFLLPDKVRDVISTPMGEMITGSDGSKTWSKQGPNVTDGTEEELKDQKQSIFRNMLLTFQHIDDPEYEFIYLETGEYEGTPVDIIMVKTADGSMSYKMALNSQTLLPERTFYFGKTMMGPGNLTDILSDYREVSGIVIPYSRKIESEGNTVAEIETTGIEINAEIDESIFTKPE